ncbi:sensor histidine kinase [Hahella ganghwensis]|uniref:sensor histidine kinase n=1 Tax=Hahella ganghwensis TaxID=286420 RepID=UPI00035E8934|nr:histidine kinase [Hahella ganghwensis]
MEPTGKTEPYNGFFLPNLCTVQALLFLVLGTEICALLFTLINYGLLNFNWDYFALTSLFMLWVVHTSAIILCQLRKWGRQWSVSQQALVTYGVVIATTTLFAVLAGYFRTAGKVGWDYWFVLQAILIAAILTGALLRYFYLQHLWHQQQRSELESRVQALQARIRPHFLFNSMNSIAGLIPEDAEAAEEAVLDLAELFRAALRESSSLVPINDELGLCERYLRIEKLRLGPRLHLEWHIKPLTKAAQVPPLTLQPLIENAIYHGIQPNPSGGTIKITAYEQGTWLYVLISNPIAPHPGSQKHQGNRIAMRNIRSRLQAFFGDQAVLKTSQLDNQFTATLRIPLTR